MNFGVFELASKYTQWKHDWEQPYLAGTKGFIYANTFEMIERIIREVGHAYGTRFEYECYDIGHLDSLKYFADRGLVKPPFLIQGIFGIRGGMGAYLENLSHFKLMADKLFGSDYVLSSFGVGRNQIPFLTYTTLIGGAVRVGLEDSLYIGRGQLATSNAQQVVKARAIIEELGHEVATPTEARKMLSLKGGDQVAF